MKDREWCAARHGVTNSLTQLITELYIYIHTHPYVYIIYFRFIPLKHDNASNGSELTYRLESVILGITTR